MPGIIRIESGPQPLEDAKQPASAGVTKLEVVVTPEPKTKDQRLADAQAQSTAAAAMRQEQNAHAPSKLSRTQETARRKRKRDNYYKAVQAALAAGRITLDDAKKMLPTRQPRVKSD
jgi:hypothetical protein